MPQSIVNLISDVQSIVDAYKDDKERMMNLRQVLWALKDSVQNRIELIEALENVGVKM